MTGADWILTAGITVLLVLGVPFAFAIGIGVVLALLVSGIDTIVAIQYSVSGIEVYALLAVPCFILAGDIMHTGGLSGRLVELAMVTARYLRGGLGMVAVLSATFFGAISGSAPATTAAIGKLTIPEMEKRGYSKSFAAALAAAYGPIGIMIPPSIPMVIWGIIANVSVPRLFLAGIVPGLLLCLALMTMCNVYARRIDLPRDSRRFSWNELGRALWDSKWALLAPVIILGGIYGGIFTPTEAGVIGVLYGLIVGLFIHRELKLADIPAILLRSMRTTAAIIFIVALSTAYGWLIALEKVADRLGAAIAQFSDEKVIVLLVLNVVLLLVGALMDTIAIMIVFSGFLISIGTQLGLDPVHLGAMIVVNLGIGLATPPFGYTLFTAAAISDVPLGRINRMLWPLIAAEIAVVVLIALVPELSLWLPNLVYG
ncbi:TRAP transporter large permease [Microbaculum marinum]|uniref:TRAP transporter large permease protein n=1 Tax=Microbaculum marinum TaxID=1764581 RepID=A0AAW9RJU4_9HYPH